MTPLTPEEEETIRTAGVAWCDEATFERVWATIDRLRTTQDRLRTTQAVHEMWREIASVAGLALWVDTGVGSGLVYTATRIQREDAATILWAGWADVEA